jgi:hypothetical protein
MQTIETTANPVAISTLSKDELIEKIIAEPRNFSNEDFNRLVSKDIDLNFLDLRNLITRIFDINESTLRQQSDATTGMMGKMNRKSTAKRQKKYYQLIEKGFRDPAFTGNKVIVAEGDSWFQFPFLINDIIDWLGREPNYAVYSIAYGGDWFTNILYEEKYIEELSIHRPDVFLISGGGNDFVGSSRLAIMVQQQPRLYDIPSAGFRKQLLQFERDDIRADIEKGYHHITDSFFSFIWTIKAQYYKLFHNLKRSGKYDHMKIITQGYDYVLPTLKKRHKKFLQGFINSQIGSGKWLMRPMMIKGITDEHLASQIMKAMIYEINCMFIELAMDPNFPNFYHIDCRNTATGWNDWYDELHLHSNKYREIANAYKRCIEGDGKQKVVRVNEMAVKPGVGEILNS